MKKIYIYHLLSYLITAIVYSAVLNWKIALVLIIGISLHECSHLLMAKKLGFQTGGFILVPFLGGVSFIKDKYKNDYQNALVAMAGPIGGTIVAVLTMCIFFITKSHFMGAAAFWMVFLNLFNLAPLSFLDGGQVFSTLSHYFGRKCNFYFKCVSHILAIIILAFFSLPITILISIFGTLDLVNDYRYFKYKDTDKEYLIPESYLEKPQKLETHQFFETLGMYLITVGALILFLLYLKGFNLSLGALVK